jgi:2-(1,2-epoxy-1,2-dihydrophenyl)acetyl-CoA isomerase
MVRRSRSTGRESYNAINEQVKQELNQALKDASRNPAVDALSSVAPGKGVLFGQDLKEHQSQKRSSGIPGQVHNPIIRMIREMERPVIAMISESRQAPGAASLARHAYHVIDSETHRVFIRISLCRFRVHWIFPACRDGARL